MATKISFDFIKKNKRDISFFVVGIILSVCLIYLFIDGTSFLVSNVETSLNVGTSPYSPMKFNINGLKSLGIYQGQPTNSEVPANTSTPLEPSGSSSGITSSPVDSGVITPVIPPVTP